MKAGVWMERAALLVLGAVFLAAGALKVMDPLGFAGDIYRYRLIGWMPSLALAVYLPWLEVVASLALVVPSLRRAAAAVLAGLCVVFLGVLVSAEARGLTLACGCFGGHAAGAGLGWDIVRDLVLLAVSAGYLVFPRSKRTARVEGPASGAGKT